MADLTHNKILVLDEQEQISDKLKIILEKEGYSIFVSSLYNSVDNMPPQTMNGLVIDPEKYLVYLNGRRMNFPKKEFELLSLLASNPDKVFTRSEILHLIWNKSTVDKENRTLDVHIRMLRKKLNEQFIETVKGVGYKLLK